MLSLLLSSSTLHKAQKQERPQKIAPGMLTCELKYSEKRVESKKTRKIYIMCIVTVLLLYNPDSVLRQLLACGYSKRCLFNTAYLKIDVQRFVKLSVSAFQMCGEAQI